MCKMVYGGIIKVLVKFLDFSFDWTEHCNIFCGSVTTSWKHLRTKVMPDFHLTYSKNGGNLGSESK